MARFEDIFSDETKRGRKIQTSNYESVGKYQIIDQGQDEIAGYTNLEDGLFRDVPAIVFGDHTRIIKYIDKPFFLGADGVKVLKSKNKNTDYKYLYYCLQSIKIPNTGYNRHFKWLKNAQIILPPIDEQRRIAAVLDKVSDLIAKRRQQLDKLDLLIKSRFIEMFGDTNLSHVKSDWVVISSIGKVVGGSTPNTTVSEYWNGEFRWISPAELKDDSYIIYDSVKKITQAGINSCSLQELPVGTVILSSRAPIGKVAIAGNTFYCNQGFKNIICNEQVIPRYLYALLKFNIDYLNSLGRGATFKEISKSILEQVKIPVPPLELQNQFAGFIDHVNRTKNIISYSLEKLETLKKSLMQKYFG